jgi:hypothetical protein
MTPRTAMTPMGTPDDLAALGGPELVYVRPVKAADLLGDARIEVGDVEIDPEQTLYAVHGADGERLAVMLDRETAFAAAKANELAPVSVH